MIIIAQGDTDQMSFSAKITGRGNKSDREFTIIIDDIDHPCVQKIALVCFEGGDWNAKLFMNAGVDVDNRDPSIVSSPMDADKHTPGMIASPPNMIVTIEAIFDSGIVADTVIPIWTIAEITHMWFETPIGDFNIRKLMADPVKYQRRMDSLYG